MNRTTTTTHSGNSFEKQSSIMASSVLNTLLYFDVFKHPLTTSEILQYCQYTKISAAELDEAIRLLKQLNLIAETNGFLHLHGHEACVILRQQRNERAKNAETKAIQNAAKISRFPFVRGVFISGSLSKGTMDVDGDIDFFIVTKPGRLWLARTLLIAYKKFFLFNSRKYFCVNYFIDTNHLAIPDQNLFVATELVFARPMYNTDIRAQLIAQNEWVKTFYPNWEATEQAIPALQLTRRQARLENWFSGKLGEWLDERFFKITIRRWEKKFPHIKESDFDLNFRSRKHVSKHHPQG
ncbi:MAG: nucleotidyltransferase domain-containing protein, partial [Bacteroidia bacterium]